MEFAPKHNTHFLPFPKGSQMILCGFCGETSGLQIELRGGEMKRQTHTHTHTESSREYPEKRRDESWQRPVKERIEVGDWKGMRVIKPI